jgi:hypothetical protein
MRALPRLMAFPLVALVVLAGCARSGDDDGDAAPGPETSTASAPVATAEPFRGLPEGAGRGVESPAGVVAGEDGLMYVVSYGSSSNPAIVRGVIAEGQELTVDVSAVENRPATMDFVPTTSSFVLPDGVDAGSPITVVLGELGTVTLDSAAPGVEAWVEIPD